MTNADETAALLALVKRSSGTWGGVTRRVLAVGSAVGVAEQDGLTADSLFEESGWDTEVQAAADAAARWWEAGYRLVTVLDDDYPVQLRDAAQVPPFLFLLGELDERDAQGVAIVGSRRATTSSLEVAGAFARHLAEEGVVVLSGLAAGVDTAAHTAALEAGGRTVGVIGTGIAKYYPAANRALQEEIARTGLLVSQFWPDSPPTKISFPLRNEVMSAWGRATCVIQADAKSGARMQARVALQQGRALYLYEAMRTEPWAREYVEAGRASFVATAADILTAP